MLHLALTFDHELYMGKNMAPFSDILIKPSYNLVSMFDDIGVKATFFTDVCFPLAFKGKKVSDECDTFIFEYEKQLCELYKRGHDVQLHIHPHWFHSEIDGNRNIIFDKQYYRLHSFGFINDTRLNAQSIIRQGISYLEEILRSANALYKCVAFRAGGFCIQPEIDLLRTLFDNGIRIDSSVSMFFSYKGGDMYYDYENNTSSSFYIPVENGLSGIMTNPTKDSLFEVAVGGYNTFIKKNIISRYNSSISSPNNGRGMRLAPIPEPLWKKSMFLKKIDSALNSPLQMTMDFYNSKALYSMIMSFAKEHNYKNKDLFVSLIGHPKALSKDHISNIKNMVERLLKNDNIRFVTMTEIAKIKRLY